MELCDSQDDEVTAWSNGLTHVIPEFRDNAQKLIAITRRAAAMKALLGNHHLSRLADFPEWNEVLEGIWANNCGYDLLQVLSRVPSTNRRPGHGARRRSRLRYRKAQMTELVDLLKQEMAFAVQITSALATLRNSSCGGIMEL